MLSSVVPLWPCPMMVAWVYSLTSLMQVWIAPSSGVATAFLEQLEKISSDSTALMLAIFAVFALVHSGLAYLRPYGDLLDFAFTGAPSSLFHCALGMCRRRSHPSAALRT